MRFGMASGNGSRIVCQGARRANAARARTTGGRNKSGAKSYDRANGPNAHVALGVDLQVIEVECYRDELFRNSSEAFELLTNFAKIG